MNKEIDIFTRNKELRKTTKIDFDEELKEVENELKKLSYEENVHQTDKNKEFGGVHLRMVCCEIVVDT